MLHFGSPRRARARPKRPPSPSVALPRHAGRRAGRQGGRHYLYQTHIQGFRGSGDRLLSFAVKRIYLIRHGKAEDYDAVRHASDADRRLTPEGKDDLARIGKHLRRVDDKIEVVLSSPLRRARETAEILADALGVKVEIFSELEPPMSANRLLTKVRRRIEVRMALVGHEPGLSQTIAAWIRAHTFATPMKKAAIARLDISSEDGDDPAILAWLAPPELFIK